MTREPDDDFVHPSLVGHRLAPHVLYRLPADHWAAGDRLTKAQPTTRNTGWSGAIRSNWSSERPARYPRRTFHLGAPPLEVGAEDGGFLIVGELHNGDRSTRRPIRSSPPRRPGCSGPTGSCPWVRQVARPTLGETLTGVVRHWLVFRPRTASTRDPQTLSPTGSIRRRRG